MKARNKNMTTRSRGMMEMMSNVERRVRSSGLVSKYFIAIPALYLLTSLYLFSMLSQHENDTSLFSPVVLRLRPHEFAAIDQFTSMKPRVLGYYFEPERNHSKRLMLWDKTSEKAQKQLQNSEYYDKENHNPMLPYEKHEECVPMHDWQMAAFPTCNSVHEASIGRFFQRHEGKYHELANLLAHGYFRDVYMIKDSDSVTNIAMKTNRFERRFDRWTMDRHRMDAMVMDRMTSSPSIMNIYGYCGVGTLVEYADGGDLLNRIDDESSASSDESSEVVYSRRLHYALGVANAIADLHTIDGSADGKFSAIVHADIFTNQMVFSEGKLKLNDFNRCHFMFWNTTSDKETCPYIYMDYNAGTFRSPEEFKYSLQSEKIDVFSMGNIFYVLLTDTNPFETTADEKGDTFVKDLVKNGARPLISGEILASSDPSVQTLVRAMEMCHTYDWKSRPSASTIRDYLHDAIFLQGRHNARSQRERAKNT